MNQVTRFNHHICLHLHDRCRTERTSGLQHLVNQYLHVIRFMVYHLDCQIQDLIRLLLSPELVKRALALEWVMNNVIHFVHHISLQLHDLCRTQRTYMLQHLLEQCLHLIWFILHHLDDPIQGLLRAIHLQTIVYRPWKTFKWTIMQQNRSQPHDASLVLPSTFSLIFLISAVVERW
jgi:hypothetical protein